MDGDGLSSLGEKGKVKIVVDFVFSFVDQLLTRSLGLEKLPDKQQNLKKKNFKISFLQINLVVKDQTTYHQILICHLMYNEYTYSTSNIIFCHEMIVWIELSRLWNIFLKL